MTAQEIAARLHGQEYPLTVPPDVAATAPFPPETVTRLPLERVTELFSRWIAARHRHPAPPGDALGMNEEFLLCLDAFDRQAGPSRPALNAEQLLRECVPGGSVCDPQQIADAIRAYCAALPANVPTWPCHCDDRGIGQPGVTCGDCPKDYGHTVTQASAPGGEPHPLTLLQAGLNNAELLAQWRKKLPGVEPTDRELSAFAVGTEVGWQRATAQAAPAPAPTEHEREMAASLLKAMARNYAAGHAWDHLDGKACTNAARLLRTQAPAVPVVQALTDAEIDALRGLDTAQRVRFYEHDFYVLSNFSAFRVTFEGQTFDTSEAAYHYQRFTDAEDRRAIQYAYSAHEAFRYAQDNKTHQRGDWDAVKVETMRRILRAKADQHEYVRRKLLETGDRELVEDSWRDDFWGWGPNRDGRNMLGRLWMEIRAELASAGDAAQGAQP